MEIKTQSMLEILKKHNLLNRDGILKKILLFLETNYQLDSSILIFKDEGFEIFYLNESMKLVSKEYKKFISYTLEQPSIMENISNFSDSSFFDNENLIYVQAPIKIREQNLGVIFFKLDSKEQFYYQQKIYSTISFEVSVVIDYIDMVNINQDAIENLLDSNRKLENIENNLTAQNKKLYLLTDGNYDFGVVSIDSEYNIIDINSHLKDLLKYSEETLPKLSDYFSQNEIFTQNFPKFLEKLISTLRNSVTTINLVSSTGDNLIFKVSGTFIPETSTFFLKMFNVTKETLITKKFATLQSKFDSLLKHNTEVVINSYDGILKGTIKFFEGKDEEFGNHLERVAEYSYTIAKYIYENSLDGGVDKKYLELLPKAAVLHDIGMLSIDESIFFKDGKLTKEEYQKIKDHPVVASKLFTELLRKYPESDLLSLSNEIALGHHERYDGSGYPYGLKGHQIPLSAKIIAFCDIFDGLTTDRIYKKGLPLDLARMMIVDYKGKQLDPFIVDIFLKVEEKFSEIYDKFQ